MLRWRASNGLRCRSHCGRVECYRVGGNTANRWALRVDGREYPSVVSLKAAKSRALGLLMLAEPKVAGR
jgi:hypothetical protein